MCQICKASLSQPAPIDPIKPCKKIRLIIVLFLARSGITEENWLAKLYNNHEEWKQLHKNLQTKPEFADLEESWVRVILGELIISLFGWASSLRFLSPSDGWNPQLKAKKNIHDAASWFGEAAQESMPARLSSHLKGKGTANSVATTPVTPPATTPMTPPSTNALKRPKTAGATAASTVLSKRRAVTVPPNPTTATTASPCPLPRLPKPMSTTPTVTDASTSSLQTPTPATAEVSVEPAHLELPYRQFQDVEHEYREVMRKYLKAPHNEEYKAKVEEFGKMIQDMRKK